MTDVDQLSLFAQQALPVAAVEPPAPRAKLEDAEFYDSAGNRLTCYGVQTSLSDVLAFVCLDEFPGVGQLIHIIGTAHARNVVETAFADGEWPVTGTMDGSGVKNTGRGYLRSPAQMLAESHPLPYEKDTSGSIGNRGRRLAAQWFISQGHKIERVNLDQEKQGIDFFAIKDGKRIAVEAKARGPGKGYANLFLQTHESNPTGNYGGVNVMRIQTNFAEGKEKFVSFEMKHRFATAIIDVDWPYTVAPGMRSVEDIEDAEQKGRLSGFTRNRDEGQNKYRQGAPLSIEELKMLPVGDVVGGYVFLWVVAPFLINGAALEIMDAWGFTPSSMLTWAKYDLENNHGYGGVGFWFLGNAEFCVVGKRQGLPSIRTGKSSLIVKPKGVHSTKPDDVHQICEERFPSPYLEVFGRRRRRGWTVLGNEAPDDGMDIRESLQRFRLRPEAQR